MSWHDDDAFWEAFEPVLFGPQMLERAPEEVSAIEALLKLEPGARVLDLCTGPGRHARELARRGYAVTGVDRTARYLERARREADAEGLALDLVQADMRAFVRPQAFDAALNLFTSFGYFDDPADNLAVLRNLRTSLRRGGQALLELAGKEALALHWQPRSWVSVGGVIFLEERHVMPGWERVQNRWAVVRDGARYEAVLDHYLYSAAELRGLLVEAGFERVEAYGSLGGTPYDENAQRLVMVAS